jgi:hypothetical protein
METETPLSVLGKERLPAPIRVYKLNHNTGNRIFVREFKTEKDAQTFANSKNTNSQFEYYVSF